MVLVDMYRGPGGANQDYGYGYSLDTQQQATTDSRLGVNRKEDNTTDQRQGDNNQSRDYNSDNTVSNWFETY